MNLPNQYISNEKSNETISSRFFSALCDLGVVVGDSVLQESALNMLTLLPADTDVVRIIKQKCLEVKSIIYFFSRLIY